MVAITRSPVATRKTPAGKPLVLVVEDNAGDALLVRTAIAEVGFARSVVVVENFVQAYRYLLRRFPYEDAPRPDLVLLDLNLPVLGGLGMLRDLRAHADWKDLKVIVFSSSRRDEDRRQADALGVLAYIAKPPLWSCYVSAMQEVERAWRASLG
jgi:two-component system, chemotaxis family, response regulator Rcp1